MFITINMLLFFYFFFIFYTVKVIDIKGLPSSICVLCKFKIDHYLQFKKQCQKSVKILNTKYTSLLLNKLKNNYNFVDNDVQKECNTTIDNSEETFMTIAVESNNVQEKTKEIVYNDKTKHIENQEIIEIHKKNAEEQDDVQNKCNTKEIIINVLSAGSSQKETEINYDLIVKKNDKSNYLNNVDKKPSKDTCLVNIIEKLYYCQYCGKCFGRKNNLDNHLKLHGPMKLYKCHYCLKFFTKIDDLEIHRSTHTENKQFKIFKCNICKNKFHNSNALLSHMEQQHKTKRTYKCDICGKIFGFLTIFQDHRLHHKHDRRFNCQYCYKVFLTNNYLKKHEREHIRGPHECAICTKVFENIQNLEMHRDIHHS